ncbi:hypothetical protein QQX98_011592 [Neonectria punicea]|uniref:Uncharacterized protein n=1 Tax=Neonectria punicea TaxID=979145 RepID=A0ABR1GL75_9HYPO
MGVVRANKSGPAKGYTEALEHRLRETETALVRLWMAASKDAIEGAFKQEDLLPESYSPGRTAPDKSSAVTQWDDFPLRSARDVDKWAREVKGASKLSDGASVRHESVTADSSPKEPDPPDHHSFQDTGLSSELPSTPPTSTAMFEPSGHNVEFDQEGGVQSPFSHRSGLHNRRQDSDDGLHSGNGPQNSRKRLRLSQDFRDQYLW